MSIIVIDTETTGLGRQKGRDDAIIQIGAVVVRDGEIIDEYNSLCWPGEQYFRYGRADRALMINNLTIDDLKASPSHQVVAMKFREFCNKYVPAALTAYNKGFDRPFVEQSPWTLQEYYPLLTWGPCIMLHAAAYLGKRGLNEWNTYFENWKWPKLADACRRLNVDLTNAHDAAGDARAAAEVMLRMDMDFSGVF